MHRRSVLLSAALLPLAAGTARAHHGWTWAEPDLSTLEGTIRTVSLAPPHPELQVEDAGGELWTVELGSPRRTVAAGFGEGAAAPGDRVTVLGNRSLDAAERLVKAVRITVAGRSYDFYPERLPPDLQGS